MTTATDDRTLASVWDETVAFLAGRTGGNNVDGAELRKQVTEKLGIATLDELRAVTRAELEGCGVPAPLARVLIGKWRGAAASPAKTTIGELRAIPYLGPRELFERFDPAEPASAFGRRIGVLAKNRPTLVFKDDGTLDREGSALILQELMEGESPRRLHQTERGAARVYLVGEGPGRFRLVHPLDGTTLRADGTGEVDGLAWGTLGEDVRAVLRIATSETRELDGAALIRDRLRLVQLFTTLKQGASVLSSLAPEAFVLYEERKHSGGLPPLRVTHRVRKKAAVGNGDPWPALRQ